jgi:hypothetical protein
VQVGVSLPGTAFFCHVNIALLLSSRSTDLAAACNEKHMLQRTA